MKKTVLIFAALFLTICSYSQEEDSLPRLGISGTVQNSTFGFQIPIWLGENVVLAPSFGTSYGDNYGWELQLGIAPRYYLNNKDLRPYLGLRGAVIMDFPTKVLTNVNQTNTPKSTTDILGGINFGGEYFFSNRFSIGVEIQANIVKSDDNSLRFGNPGGINFNTGTLIMFNIYF